MSGGKPEFLGLFGVPIFPRKNVILAAMYVTSLCCLRTSPESCLRDVPTAQDRENVSVIFLIFFSHVQ